VTGGARVVALLLAGVALARADAPVRLERLFPTEADVQVSAPGLARLVLPPEVLVACRPDLSDVRLFTPDGAEVPYAVDAGVGPGAVRRETTRAAVSVLDVARSQTPRTDAPSHVVETYRLGAPPEAGAWELVVDTRRSGFVRTVRVTAGTPDGRIVADGSLVRLGDPVADRMRVALPDAGADPLVVTIAGDEGFYLEPTFRFERSRTLADAGEAVVPLGPLAVHRLPGRSVIEVPRPAGIVPELLRIGTSTPAFSRRVRVWDVRAGLADVALGERIVARVAADEPPERGDVPVAAARGARLRVEVEDGDSPPLADLALAAVVRRPTLVFALPAGTEATLRFGGGRAFRPRYDLAALAPGGDGGDASARLWDPARLATATLGPVRANPSFDAAPALAFAMRAGAAVDLRRFAWRRPLTVPASADGVARLVLAPDDLAHARDDLADVRVVDADGLQWPFLVDRDVPAASLRLAVDAPVRDGSRSRQRLRSGVGALPIAGVTLDVDAPFFHRAFRLLGPHEAVLASGTLARDARRPEPLALAFAPTRTDVLTLVIDDGDDAPLPVRGAEAAVPAAALLVVAAPGEYALLAGQADAPPPRYELGSARDVVVALDAAAIASRPGGPNPAFSRTAEVAAGGLPGRVAVWFVLAAAVALLGLLTLRAARG